MQNIHPEQIFDYMINIVNYESKKTDIDNNHTLYLSHNVGN